MLMAQCSYGPVCSCLCAPGESGFLDREVQFGCWPWGAFVQIALARVTSIHAVPPLLLWLGDSEGPAVSQGAPVSQGITPRVPQSFHQAPPPHATPRLLAPMPIPAAATLSSPNQALAPQLPGGPHFPGISLWFWGRGRSALPCLCSSGVGGTFAGRSRTVGHSLWRFSDLCCSEPE